MRAQHWETNKVENDWIILDEADLEELEHEIRESTAKRADKATNKRESASGSTFLLFTSAKANQVEHGNRQRRQMALDTSDIELIRASWVLARKDPTGSGVLLFKGLFTKFPAYLKFFTQFTDLDIENLHENKRLIKHAVKVIDTVTSVVDSIGEQSKADQLNEALINLVRGHLKRKIGLQEFRNLGIVIIDFICDLQQRRGSPTRPRTNSPNENNSLESIDSSEAEDSCTRCQNYNHNHSSANHAIGRADSLFESSNNDSSSPSPTNLASSLDMNQLVTAWTKLYGSILDLVKSEGGEDIGDQGQQ